MDEYRVNRAEDSMNTPLPDERQPPLYFAGRSDELGVLKNELDALCTTGRAPGGLHLVAGVPGVGKTQMAVKYMDDVAGTTIEGVDVYTIAIEPDGLRDETSLFRSICEGLDEESKGNEIAQIENRISGGSIGAGVMVVKGSASATIDVGRHTGDLGLMLRRSLSAGLWDEKALVILVDELQHINADGIRRLAVLHMNINNLPMQLLGFGLQHTPRVLANPPGGHAGISRIRPPMTLGPLSESDAIDAVAGNLEIMGHLSNAMVSERSVAALAQASFGFPQHIRGYLKGADAAVRKYGHLEDVALQYALRQGDANRRGYYELRLGAVENPARLLPLVAHMLDTGQDVVDPISAKAVLRDDAEVVDAAVAHGVLTQSPRGDLSFGIPSFASYMQEWHRDVAARRAKT